MIEGFNIRCTVGGLEVLRSPRIVLTLGGLWHGNETE